MPRTWAACVSVLTAALAALIAGCGDESPDTGGAGGPIIGNFGGGRVLLKTGPNTGGNTLMSLRALGDGRLQVVGEVSPGCQDPVSFAASTTIGSDGVFVVRGTTYRTEDAGRSRSTYEVRGTMTPSAAEGTARVADPYLNGEKCDSGAVKFAARRPDGKVGSPGAKPSANYYGLTSQRNARGTREPVIVRATSNGRRVARAFASVTLRCGNGERRQSAALTDTNLKIRGGRFGYRLKLGTNVSPVAVAETFRGRIGADGATGTLSSSIIVRHPNSSRTNRRATCRTGRVSWTAAP